MAETFGQPDGIAPAPPRTAASSSLWSFAAALALLGLMGWTMASGAWQDSVTFDEQPHVAAGYTYLTRRTLDFNPEHPPLLKDLAALPLLFMNLDLSWEQDEQRAGKPGDWPDGDPWEFGRKLLDHSGVPPERTMFAVRAPVMLLTLLLGAALFLWTERRYGGSAALLALTFYTFSPTILAHGRLVTTDLAAAAGFFLALIAYLRFLERPAGRNILLAGAALGFALLTKFSTFLLVPIFIVLAVAWHFLHRRQGESAGTGPRRSWGSPLRWGRGALLLALPKWRSPVREPRATASPRLSAARVAGVFVVGFLCVYALYAHHLGRMPHERQIERAKVALSGRGVGNTPKDIARWMTASPSLRPLGAYFTGLLQVMIRSAEGNSPYLLGVFHPKGVPQYFPLVYLMKEPVALHVLSAIALLSALLGVLLLRGMPLGVRGSLLNALRLDLAPAAMLFVLIVYWAVSLRSQLNIGVRHLLPVLPLTFVLVARELRQFSIRLPVAMNLRENFIVHAGLVLIGYFGFAAVLLGWQVASVSRVAPHHISYFNELAGGPENGWRNALDSNADWGQDLGRLAGFVQERSIEKISLDYFGAADANRYLPGKWEAINSCFPPRTGWVAVSVMSYQSSLQNPDCDYRRWLPIEKLAAKVGYSTLIFYVE